MRACLCLEVVLQLCVDELWCVFSNDMRGSMAVRRVFVKSADCVVCGFGSTSCVMYRMFGGKCLCGVMYLG